MVGKIFRLLPIYLLPLCAYMYSNLLHKRYMRFPHLNVVRKQRYQNPVAIDPPQKPKNFGKDFQLDPIPYKLNLEISNPHVNDELLTFNPDKHLYYYNNRAIEISVTKLVENYFSEFDPEVVVDKMMSGNKWPRVEYMNPDGTPLTREQILSKWKTQGEYARNYGSWVHRNIEFFYNSLVLYCHFKYPSYVVEDNLFSQSMNNGWTEKQMFENFDEEYVARKEIIPYRTEWRICAPDLGLAGSVDFVGKLPDGTFCIIDWKTSKKLETSLSNEYKKAK